MKTQTRQIKSNEELQARYDTRNSFYKKAYVIEYDNGDKELLSYGETVAVIRYGTARVLYWGSQTTGRHIKEFFKQQGFWADNKKQILKDYQ